MACSRWLWLLARTDDVDRVLKIRPELRGNLLRQAVRQPHLVAVKAAAVYARRCRVIIVPAVAGAVAPSLHRDQVALVAEHRVHHLSDGRGPDERQERRVALEQRR
eukprot:COSAG06_NODE_3022_length_5949_cov_8.542051_9_plen_105_part_01